RRRRAAGRVCRGAPDRDDRRRAAACCRARSDDRAGGMTVPWRFGAFPEYVPVAERRAKALAQARKLEKRGRKLQPVAVDGRRIASSFWGKAWCENLESYSDFANRLPRGRTYVRNGSVIDLRIAEGRVDALVAGTSLYEVRIEIGKLSKSHAKRLTQQCR